MYETNKLPEDTLITRNTSSASTDTTIMEANITDVDREQKKAQVLQQETNSEPEITREQLSIGKRLLNWRTIVPLIIVVVALVYFAKQAHINPQQTWAAFRAANSWFLLLAFLIYYLSFPIRTLRWRMLLQNIGYTKANGVHLPKFPKLLEILYISWFANVIVPAKLGDLYRAYLLRTETGLPASRTFGTVLAERLLDLLVLLMLFIPSVIISLHANLPPQLHVGLFVTLALVVLGAVALFVLRAYPQQIARLVPQRFRAHYNHFQEGTLGSFRRVPLPGRVNRRCMGLRIVTLLLCGLSLWTDYRYHVACHRRCALHRARRSLAHGRTVHGRRRRPRRGRHVCYDRSLHHQYQPGRCLHPGRPHHQPLQHPGLRLHRLHVRLRTRRAQSRSEAENGLKKRE